MRWEIDAFIPLLKGVGFPAIVVNKSPVWGEPEK